MLAMHDCLMLAREFNSYVHDHPRSVVRIQQNFEFIMNFKKSPFSILNKDKREMGASRNL